MKGRRVLAGPVVIAAILAMLLLGASAAAQELHILMAVHRPALAEYLQTQLIPAFEERFGARVRIEYTTWNERLDKILILHAAGTPPDIVQTGFYSPYHEGSIGLLAPLDGYLAEWEHTKSYPPNVWEALSWNGRVYAVPLNASVRGVGYHKQVFGEAGYDPDRTPQSWEELVEYTRRLTRLNPDGTQVVQRGFFIDTRPLSGNAQPFFWFLLQNGISEVNLETMQSNLSHPKALEALQYMLQIQEASHALLPGLSGGLPAGRVAMQWVAPGLDRVVLFDNPDDLGVFAPRRSPDSQPVSHAFIDGLAIVEASRNKDLAWEFIKMLLDDDSLIEVQKATGWIGGRTDLIHALAEMSPTTMHFVELFAYAKSSIMPPPRDTAQGEVAALLTAVWNYEMPPQEALLRADAVWNRLLAEWQEEMK